MILVRLLNQVGLLEMYRVITDNLVDMFLGDSIFFTVNIISDAVLLSLDDVRKVLTDLGIVIYI